MAGRAGGRGGGLGFWGSRGTVLAKGSADAGDGWLLVVGVLSAGGQHCSGLGRASERERGGGGVSGQFSVGVGGGRGGGADGWRRRSRLPPGGRTEGTAVGLVAAAHPAAQSWCQACDARSCLPPYRRLAAPQLSAVRFGRRWSDNWRWTVVHCRVNMAGLVGKIPAIPTLGAQGVTLRNVVYDLVMKRTSTYVGAIFVCAMVAENTLDSAVDTMWSVSNKGVRLPPAERPRPRACNSSACVHACVRSPRVSPCAPS
eukprot:COSAG02_NODE_4073_length_5830_cov_3.915373_4_plen_257_part_00